jgi:hypothetical protein
MMYPVTLPPGKEDAADWLRREHGIECGNHDGQQWADNPNAQSLIDAWDPLPEAKDKLKKALDRERQARVDQLANDRMKFLSLAQFDELLFFVEQVGSLTVEQTRLRTALLGSWATIGDVETAAMRIGTDIDALPDMGAAVAFDVTTSPHWSRPNQGIKMMPIPRSRDQLY